MSMSEQDLPTARASRFMRAARSVGDLNNSFFAEERQRDVWNEASAVGFQMMLWLGLIAADLMIWIGGRDGLPYALATFAVPGIASVVTLSYAQRLGVDAARQSRVRRPSTIAYVVLLASFVIGIVVRAWAAA